MFRENVSLKEFSNYHIGGPARYFLEVGDTKKLEEALREAKQRNLKIFILGGGTNLLISDSGFDGLVLKPAWKFLEADGEKISVGVGILVSELLNFCIERGLSGLEWAGGLPGTIGGAIRGNAGCFGGESKDVVESVKSFDINGLKEKERKAGECGFSYRSSIFKKEGNRELIISAKLKLKKGSPQEIEKLIQEKIDYRKERHPLEYPNIGSIFKNVDVKLVPLEHMSLVQTVIKKDPFPVVPAAFLIAEAGLKGIGCGGAMISEKHPNFIVNFKDAKASDVKELIKLVKKEVKGRFQIELEEEIVYV